MILQEESTSRRIRSYRRLRVCVINSLGVYTSSRDFLEIGIDLGTVGFQASFEGTEIGRMFLPVALSRQYTSIIVHASFVHNITGSCTGVCNQGTSIRPYHTQIRKRAYCYRKALHPVPCWPEPDSGCPRQLRAAFRYGCSSLAERRLQDPYVASHPPWTYLPGVFLFTSTALAYH